MHDATKWNYNVGKAAWNIDVMAYKKIAKLEQKDQDKFISIMALNPHSKDKYVIWAKNILDNGFKNVDLEKTLTWLSPTLIKKVKINKYNPETPIVVMSDKQVGHSGLNKTITQQLTKSEYLRVYDIINNPDEIYYDYTRPQYEQIAFVKLIPNSNKCIKICVRFNQKSRIKNNTQIVNKVTTIGKVNQSDMNDKTKYKKIE